MHAQSLITEARYHLHDLAGTGYPDELLLEFINDGLCLIYQLRPEVFSVSKVLPAKEGEVQCLDRCCDRLLSVDGVVDACGNPLDLIRQGSVKMARAFDKKPMGKHAYTFSIRDNVASQFEIHPPIKAKEDIYFRITCTSPPAPAEDLNAELPDCLHHEALLDYVLYRAYAVESDSPNSQALAMRYYQQMLQLLGVTRLMAQEILEDNHASPT